MVWSLADVSSPDEIEARLVGLESYQAFTLVALSRTNDRSWEWDGEKLSSGNAPSFLTSSSFQFKEVRKARETCHAKGLVGEELHASPCEPPSAYSIRMNRPDAQTWSRSHLKINGKITWEYFAEQPDLVGESSRTITELALR